MLIKFIDGTQREIELKPFANLSEADLSGADLRGADLRGADLCEAHLRGADLCGANLSRADLCGANLSRANLSEANLSEANLSGANLRGADLCEANLHRANLREADLRGANLRGAHLSEANLSEAHLRGADLCGANLCEANLTDTKGLEQQCILPEGDIVGYKKLADGSIAVLRIPASAKRVNAHGSRKCRAEYALVVSGTGDARHKCFAYAPGWIYPDKYDPDPRVECSHGIHFFITEQEAKDY
jgi:hypothetical protein